VVEPHPSEKNIKSVGIMTFPIYGKIKFMFQTTNQYMYVWVLYELKQPSFLSAAGLKPCAAAWA
jgi:hypothetical protein